MLLILPESIRLIFVMSPLSAKTHFKALSLQPSIGKQAFSYLYSLTDAVVNCSLTSDAQQLFYYCTMLVNATMNTTYIPTGCFQGCRSLVNVYLPSTPPTSALPTSNTGFKLHIPAGTLSAYSSATNWSALTSYFVEDSPLS